MNKPRSIWFDVLWQSGLVVLLSVVLALTFNYLRSDGLPLFGDWASGTRPVSADGEDLAISIDEAQALFFTQAALFLDARSADAYAAGHIMGARNLPWQQFDQRFPRVMADVTEETLIVTYCDGEGCALSKDLAVALLAKGYFNVRVLVNGWTLWRDNDLPTDGGSGAAK